MKKIKVLLITLFLYVYSYSQHIGEPYGFAAVPAYGVNEVTGGSGGEVVIINGQADAKILQDALDDDNEPRIIYINGQVQLPAYTDASESPVSDLSTRMTCVKSNKTIIGLGCDAEITGSGLSLYSGSGENVDYEAETTVKNVIIQNITFSNGLDDEINIQGGSHHIWIDHCTFHSGYDGLLDFKRASDYLTVSNCHFRNHNKMSLVGHSPDVRDMDIGHLRVTYDRCYFDDFEESLRSSRHPRIRHGIVHVTNCYFHGQSINSGIDGIVCNEDGRLTVEGCYFQWPKWATQVAYGDSNPGEVKERNNILFECKALNQGEEVWFGTIGWNSSFSSLTSEFPDYESGDPYDYYSFPIEAPDNIPSEVLDNAGACKITVVDPANLVTLIINIEGDGSVSKSPNQISFEQGETVSLTAIPGADIWTFANWSGDASGTNTSISVTMDSDKTITATFTANKRILTVSPNEYGSVSVSPQKQYYDIGETVTLTANPITGGSFLEWTGDLSGTATTMTITMDTDMNIGATFEPATHNVTININGSGIISPDINGSNYEGEEVSTTAHQYIGSEFVNWTGDISSSDPTITFTVNAPVSYTANFQTISEPSIYEFEDGYFEDGIANFEDTHPPYSGTGAVNTENSNGTWTEITVYAPATGEYTCEVFHSHETNDRGDVIIQNSNTGSTTNVYFPASGSWDTWTSTQFTLPLQHGENILRFIGDSDNGAPNLDKIEISLNSTLYYLTVNQVSGGTISPTTGSYSEGADVSITATPATGYVFTNWTGDLSGSTNPVIITMNANKTISAVFTELTDNVPVSLIAGWNLIACPIEGNTAIETALSSIWSEVETVKDFNGFWDINNDPFLNSLNSLDWGKGYFVKVVSNCELNW